ncbi:2-nitropropane dioxygenase [Fictibacillus macauensis ZFHKF-1]|uniref:Probable nitronate monooxygenase n=1 Tax=Fictibacillus macauensis ZFHKF-1 TaxID=1196324 RepID=I8AKC3_9BACL|nr:nitronate monooxygenase [Fictibacillus macauensis]EIT86302.1 2-nitropropane dioxygenase [Fictibacillus macauensis ZFHKF-1]
MKHCLQTVCGVRYPIISAGMAGGPGGPDLVAAVSEHGGLGTLGAGYMEAADITAAIAEIKRQTKQPFAVNLFLPVETFVQEEAVQAMQRRLSALGAGKSLEQQVPSRRDPFAFFEQQLQAVMESDVKIISFTFHLPSKALVDRLKEAQMIVIATATSVKEATLLEQVGVDIICAQGSEAGGHRGTFLDREEDSLIGTMALVPQICDAVALPVIAAGGIMDARGMAAAFMLGASAVQLGTFFLAAQESGAHQVYKEAVLQASERDLVLTKAFSGKLARGINNQFITEMKNIEALPYPIQHELTTPLRQWAKSVHEGNYMSLWAGQGITLVQSKSVRELMHELFTAYNKLTTHLQRFE